MKTPQRINFETDHAYNRQMKLYKKQVKRKNWTIVLVIYSAIVGISFVSVWAWSIYKGYK